MTYSGIIGDQPKQAAEAGLLNSGHDIEAANRLVEIMAAWESLLQRETATVADQLHNDLGQVLTALRLDISLFKLQYQTDEVLLSKANAMLGLTDRCMRTLCRLIDTLRPVDLTDGFASALERLCLDYSRTHGLSCKAAIFADCACLDEIHAGILLRILLEALHEIVRHAAAQSVCISVNQTPAAGLRIKICDDGDDFAVGEATKCNSFSLSLIRQSAAALGWQFEISSKTNAACMITLNIPPESLSKHRQ